MSSSKSVLPLSLLFPAIVLARIALSLTPLPHYLKNDHLLASPLTSFSQLQEGIYLFNHDIDPYSGGTFRHSPLYLALFTTILPTNQKLCSILWTICDAVGAWALIQTWRRRQNVKDTPRDSLIAATYLLNPYVFLPTLALSTSSCENTLALLAFMFAAKGKTSATLFLLAFLSNLVPSSILILPPLLLVLISNPYSHLASPRTIAISSLKKTVPLMGEFLIYFAALILASCIVSGGTSWIPQTWGATLMLPDLTPNPGLWWYFFTEMFDHFRPFFLVVFSVHLLIYIAPLCIKFQYDPLYATFLLIGVLGTFKAYPTLSDPGLFLSLISLFPETYPYMNYPVVTALLHLHASLLLPLFHHLWLTTGTGNANFFYASTLVFACANGAALLDCIWSGLRIAMAQVPENYVVVQE